MRGMRIYVVALVTQIALQCQYRDYRRFRDVYINENSTLGKSIFSLDLVEKGRGYRLMVSLCHRFPEEIFRNKNCEGIRERNVFFIKIGHGLTEGNDDYECLEFMERSSISEFVVNKSRDSISFLFYEQNESRPTKITFPNHNSTKEIDYREAEGVRMEILLKGEHSEIDIEDGYLIWGGLSFTWITCCILILIVNWRFAVISKMSVSYVSIFICGASLNFFDCYLLFVVSLEALNLVFQVVANPTAIVASMIVIVVPLQCVSFGSKKQGVVRGALGT